MARVKWPPQTGARPADIEPLARQIVQRAAKASRFLVAIAGPPGAGKSSLASNLGEALVSSGESAAVVPMDGFHLDNAILKSRGLLPRKGAPETFDFAGFEALLARIARREPDVAVPLFDRQLDLARAGAAIVSAETRFILVEGNYLLLDEAPWTRLAPLFDLSLFVDVPREELERRLIRRWLDHDHTAEQAKARALSNDIPNAERVLARRLPADLTIRNG
jgi:pantothenate kinase